LGQLPEMPKLPKLKIVRPPLRRAARKPFDNQQSALSSQRSAVITRPRSGTPPAVETQYATSLVDSDRISSLYLPNRLFAWTNVA
jgi:hypothetical protein